VYINSIQSNLPANNKFSFKGLSPEVVKNQMRIYLCQDIFAEKLKVKLPETELEKEVLLEVLKNRLHLDKLTRLANGKIKLKTMLNEAVDLTEKDPENSRLNELKTELAKKGNLEAVVDTMNKSIEKEKKIKKSALDYFANIRSLEDEYFKKHLITTSKADHFFKTIKTNNINKDGKYSTEDLIDIISKYNITNHKNSEQQISVKKKKSNINKNRFIEILISDYEDFIRKNVNIYRPNSTSVDILKSFANNYVTEKFSDLFNKFPEVTKQLDRICTSIRVKILNKIKKFENLEIYNLEKILNEMDRTLSRSKNLQKEIDILNEKVKINNDEKLNKTLIQKKAELTKEKILWQEFLDTIVYAEAENRKRITEVGCEEEYNYLVEHNKTINKFKELHKIFKENNDMLPDEEWENFLKN